MRSSIAPKTGVQRQDGGIVTVRVFPDEQNDHVGAEIADFTGSLGGQTVREGELVITNNGLNDVTFTLNNQGELVAFGDPNEIKRYSIDANGYLIYT